MLIVLVNINFITLHMNGKIFKKHGTIMNNDFHMASAFNQRHQVTYTKDTSQRLPES